MVNLSINWSSLSFVAGDAIKAAIRLSDSSGVPPTDLAWILYRNGVQIASGSNRDVQFQTSSAGLYRIKATAGGSTAESAISVGSGFEIQASPIPPEVEPTCVYLGALYCDELTGAGGPCPTLPYQLACFSQVMYLLPGTTHISFDLDPQQQRIDDEVVVRTPTGNWLINGVLHDEEIGYDYQGGRPLLVAPADGVLRTTIEAFNVNGDVANPFNFRVRVKCWRLGPALYQYIRCPFTTWPGGNGKRSRQFAALFTEMEVECDVESPQDRLGLGVNVYKTPEVTTMPLTVLATDGRPNPVQAATGLFFTDSNCYAVYEPDSNDLPELNAKAISAQDGGLRPFYVTLEEPADPPIIQRIKRLRGKLVVYMSQGGITKGSVINVRVVTSKMQTTGVREVLFSIPVTESVYNNNTDIFQRLTSVAVDISDFQFSDNGVTVYFSVDETNADPEPLPCDDPDPVRPDEFLYTNLRAPAVLYDGACYTNPVVQPTVAAEAHPVAGGITGCHEAICGPVGLYCYTDVATGSRSADFRQPLYNPAPFVSYGSDPWDCYGDPVFLYEITSGTQYQDSISAQTDALCGDGYIYEQCAGGDRIVTVYPHNTVPHDVIAFGSECWSRTSGTLAGSVANYIMGTLGWDIISAGSVAAVADCSALECSGSVAGGDSVFYRDTQTDQRVPVHFEGMDIGVPWVGTALQVVSTGLGAMPRGEKTCTFTVPRIFLFSVVQGGQVNINFGLSDFARNIVVVRGGVPHKFALRVGVAERIVAVQSGDQVYADIGNIIGILSDRTRGKRTVVRWRPIVILPRVFDTVTLAATGANVIQALGFTGITTRSPYTLMSPLPKDVEQELPNPDNIVTVQAATGPEYVLVRTRAVGDPVPQLPGNTEWYAGQSLSGSLTFRFYTTREDQGAHGEMDVWLSNETGHFPVYFKVDPYRTLGLQGGDLDVLLMLSFNDTNTRDQLRSSISVLHQRFLDLGVTPRYGVIVIAAPPATPAGFSNDFVSYDTLVNDAYWLGANLGTNFGSFQSAMTTVWTAGTLMDWTPGARRSIIAITPFSAWDYPPGFVEPSTGINRTKALQSLADNDTIYFGVVNQVAPVPINPFTFILPSNVPQTHNVLAAAAGGKIYTTTAFGTDPNPIMSDIAASANTAAFATRTESEITDVSRNSLRVTANGTDARWPNEYVAEDGERISILESTGTILFNHKVFVKVGPDSGISSIVYPGAGVISYEDAWFTTDLTLWETTDGQPWLMT